MVQMYVSCFTLLQIGRWQQGIRGENLLQHGGFVPVKPFIFSDGEVLGEQARACYDCATPPTLRRFYFYKKVDCVLLLVSLNETQKKWFKKSIACVC